MEPTFTSEQLQQIIDRTADDHKLLAPYMAADEARELALVIQRMRAVVTQQLTNQVLGWKRVTVAVAPLLPVASAATEKGRRGRRVMVGPVCRAHSCSRGAGQPGRILCKEHLKLVTKLTLKEFKKVCRPGRPNPRRQELADAMVAEANRAN